MLWDYVSVWPVFDQKMVTVPYISQSIDFALSLEDLWCVNIILWDYVSVWPNVWPRNKCRSLWPIFHGPLLLPYLLKTCDVWTSYFGIMCQYDPTFDLEINVGHCDLYFMGHCFCLISWIQCDVWTSYFGIVSQYGPTFDLNKCRSLWPIFHGPVILPFILKTVWCMNITIWDYESVWPNIWPQNKCRSLCPIFHGPVILPDISKTMWWWLSVIFSDNETVWPKLWPENKCRSTWPVFHGLVILLNIFKIIWWMNIIVGIMDQCDTKIDLIKYM